MDGGVLLAIAVVFVLFWIYILLPAGMAERRGRSRVGWVVLSVVFSPLLACLLLALLGQNPDRRSPERP